jgi:adenosylcobyric acid synthase
VVIAEGAGSPAEINLRRGDYVNLGLAREFGLPVVVVGDIDRGGVFASLYGTVALLEPEDRRLITAFVINKFRGDEAVLAPGLIELTRRTGVPFAGVLPWLPDLWLDAEDTLEVGRWRRRSDRSPFDDDDTLRVAVIRLPRVSNVTDLDALAAEPGVEVLVTTESAVVAGADLAILPGSRSTVDDLTWLRERGLAEALVVRARRGAPVLGICGGYQMLAAHIADDHESRRGVVDGLGLLPVQITFDTEKVLGRPTGAWRGEVVNAYEIHHGTASIRGAAESFLDGCRSGSVWGTMWHGAFENDEFRRAWLGTIAEAAGSGWRPGSDSLGYADRREAMINTLADAVDAHLDLGMIMSRSPFVAGSRQ